MSKRYTYEEKLKIEYLKCKIKEMRYLKYMIKVIEEEIDDLDSKIEVITNSTKSVIKMKNIKAYSIELDKKLNDLINQKEKCYSKIKNIDNELQKINFILDSLTPLNKQIAIDLFITKESLIKISDKYFITNPYQTLNDELKCIELDKY